MSGLSRHAVEQAIHWLVLLRDEPVPDAERQAFERWLAADPLNGQALRQVQGHLDLGLHALTQRTPGLRQALTVPRPSRRHLLRGALALAGTGVAMSLLSRPGLPLAQITADVRTGTAQRQRQVLADGSELLLDAQSAVDVHFTADQRLLVLRAGRLLVNARAGTQPLVVATPFGQVRSAQARLGVGLFDSSAHAWVLERQAEVVSLGGMRATLTAGHGARFDARGIEPLAASRIGETRWQDGWLDAQDWSLGEVVDALRVYRRGVVRVSPQAAALRVSGGFSLDHPDRALAALEQSLPLRVQRYLDWWVNIDLA